MNFAIIKVNIVSRTDFVIVMPRMPFLLRFSGESVPEDPPYSPQDLVTSEVTARSFRVSWTHAPGNVLKYRVIYYPSKGGQPKEVSPSIS